MNLALKLALTEHPETQYRVAERLGVAHSSISKFIAGIQRPTEEQRKKLSTILNRSEAELFAKQPRAEEIHNET
jgi:transcriptional regulator with XRE-family HTH domain|tara:strand:- start:2396 stop:2617 length:222 start_codon:yes stop_codon:yes gene_type:complete